VPGKRNTDFSFTVKGNCDAGINDKCSDSAQNLTQDKYEVSNI
jgi:hypothetical protein